MNVTVIGEEIFLGGEKVATVEASTVSLAEDFKQWVEKKMEMAIYRKKLKI